VFFVIGFIVITILQITTGFLTAIFTTPSQVRPSETVNKTLVCITADDLFGLIPKIQMSSYTLLPGTNATFSTDKPEKEFPTFPSTLSVYQLQNAPEILGSVQDAQATAASFGFDSNKYLASNSLVSWQNSDGSRVFTFDKENHLWKLTTDLNKAKLSSTGGAVNSSIAQAILSAVNVSYKNYSNPDISYSYILRKFDKSLTTVTDPTTANIVNITFNKNLFAMTCKDQNGGDQQTNATVLSPDITDPSFMAQVTGGGQDLTGNLIGLNLREFKIPNTTATKGTYTLKSVDDAFLGLQQNKGTLYWILPVGGNQYAPYIQLKVTDFEVFVDSTKIVYVEPQKYLANDASTHYIQPYFKFVGRATISTSGYADFIFLVPALSDSSYK
jgi:hypothetical protein